MGISRRTAKNRKYIAILIGAVAALAVLSTVFCMPATPADIQTGAEDDVRPLSKSLRALLGIVDNTTCYAERFEVTGDSGLGLYGSFNVGADSLVNMFVIDDEGWKEFTTTAACGEYFEIPSTSGEDEWHYRLPRADIWYVVYSRVGWIDLQKDVEGFTCRDLTAPSVAWNYPLTSVSGIFLLNFTVTDLWFDIDWIEVYVDDELLRSPYTLDMAKSFGDVVEWDTTALEDGNHLLRFRVCDSAGNSANWTYNVKVYNTFDYTVPVLAVTSVIALIALGVLCRQKEVDVVSAMIGVITLAVMVIVTYIGTMRTSYDINEFMGLITGTAGIIGIPVFLAKIAQVLRGPRR